MQIDTQLFKVVAAVRFSKNARHYSEPKPSTFCWFRVKSGVGPPHIKKFDLISHKETGSGSTKPDSKTLLPS